MKKAFPVVLLSLILIICFVSCKHRSSSVENLMDSIDYKKNTPEWARGANVYEVNIRQYTPEGTFVAFQQHLPRLKKMGVEILWLMPINPIGNKNRKGSLGNYYSIRDYKSVHPEFGTELDFKNLVNEAHKLGMYVIIDWVANHTSWDNVWIKQHPEWYSKDSLGNIIRPGGTDWDDTADLNYDNPELRRAMIDAMAHWVRNADIDGFRCDAAGMIPLSFWIHARKAIDEIKPNCFFLAQDGEPQIHQAFDMSYDWPLKNLMNDIAKGKKNANDLIKHFEYESKRFNQGDIRMHFTTDHIENSFSGSEHERFGEAAVDAFTVFTYTIPGMALTYTGQEEPLKRRLKFYDKDSVGFKKYERAKLIMQLNELKKCNSALWSVNYNGGFQGLRNTSPENVFSFVRTKKKTQVVCVFNFSAKEQVFKINDLVVGNFRTYLGQTVSFKPNEVNKLKPWGYSVMVSLKME